MTTFHTSRNMGRHKRGFALLVAVVFMSVMLSFGLALGSLAYKQEVLASGAIESQYAFYVADAGLECLLYADQQQNLFAYPPSQPATPPQMTCENLTPVSSSVVTYNASQYVVKSTLSLDGGKRCADVTIYKPSDPAQPSTLFSQGYDVPCSTVANPNGVRFVARGVQAHY